MTRRQTRSPFDDRCVPPRRRPRRAFATTTAIFLIAIVGVALAALTARLASTARSARAAQDDAQARALLRAAAATLARTLPPGEHDLPLPPALHDQHARATATITPTDRTVRVTVNRARLEEALPPAPGPGPK